MWREDDATAVAGPMFHVQPGVVAGEERVAPVAENRLDKIEVAHQAAGREEAHLHAFFRADAGDFGADNRPQQQGDKRAHRLALRRGKGEFERVIGRPHGAAE